MSLTYHAEPCPEGPSCSPSALLTSSSTSGAGTSSLTGYASGSLTGDGFSTYP